jgi:hypothetical protein
MLPPSCLNQAFAQACAIYSPLSLVGVVEAGRRKICAPAFNVLQVARFEGKLLAVIERNLASRPSPTYDLASGIRPPPEFPENEVNIEHRPKGQTCRQEGKSTVARKE